MPFELLKTIEIGIKTEFQEEFTRMISSTKKIPKAAPKAKFRKNGWKKK